MGIETYICSQFGNPRGIVGSLAGKIMANRGSNLERDRLTVELLDIGPEHRVLEVGFGPGVALALAAAKAGSGFVAGIDRSSVMLTQATDRNREAIECGRMDLRLASVEKLPEFDCAFDRVFAINSVGFWDSPQESLIELWEMMAPGGRIAITEQPRLKGATEADAASATEKYARLLSEAGFTDIQAELLELSPPAVCVTGKTR